LHDQLDALARCYYKALTASGSPSDSEGEYRPGSGPSDNSPIALGRADAEMGRSLFRGLGGNQVMIARLSPDLVWTYLTPALEGLLGYPLTHLAGRALAEMVPPDDQPRLIDSLQEALETGEGHNIVFRVRTAAGEERHVQMDVLTRYDDQATPL